MKITFVVFWAALSILAPHTALADTQPDKTSVIKKLANELFDAYKKQYSKRSVKPRLVIAEVVNNGKELSDNEVSQVVDQFEERLTGFAEVLDRDKSIHLNKEEEYQLSGAVNDKQIQNLGNKHGATQILCLAFKETIAPSKEDVERVTITAKLTAIEVKTSRKDLVKTISVEYEHTIFTEHYYVRDTIEFVAATTGTLTAIGAIVMINKVEEAYKKYKNADKADDAAKYKKESQQDEKIMWGAAGVSVASWMLWFWAAGSERNLDVYHEYELTIMPGFGTGLTNLGVVWNF